MQLLQTFNTHIGLIFAALVGGLAIHELIGLVRASGEEAANRIAFGASNVVP
jgi:hypothetical protein